MLFMLTLQSQKLSLVAVRLTTNPQNVASRIMGLEAIHIEVVSDGH